MSTLAWVEVAVRDGEKKQPQGPCPRAGTGERVDYDRVDGGRHVGRRPGTEGRAKLIGERPRRGEVSLDRNCARAPTIRAPAAKDAIRSRLSPRGCSVDSSALVMVAGAAALAWPPDGRPRQVTAMRAVHAQITTQSSGREKEGGAQSSKPVPRMPTVKPTAEPQPVRRHPVDPIHLGQRLSRWVARSCTTSRWVIDTAARLATPPRRAAPRRQVGKVGVTARKQAEGDQ